MKEAKHTPGPWTADLFTNADGSMSDNIGNEKLDICVSFNRWPEGSDYEEFEANARLISAAPEMLACLKRLADAIDSGHIEEQSFGTLEAYRLIRKATGSAE